MFKTLRTINGDTCRWTTLTKNKKKQKKNTTEVWNWRTHRRNIIVRFLSPKSINTKPYTNKIITKEIEKSTSGNYTNPIFDLYPEMVQLQIDLTFT